MVTVKNGLLEVPPILSLSLSFCLSLAGADLNTLKGERLKREIRL